MLGYFIGHIYKYRLSVCIQNLARAFPHLSYQDISRHRRNFYKNFGRILWENFYPNRIKLQLADSALETLNWVTKQQRQTIFLLGHYGNWEILNKLPEHTDMPVQALYKPLKNNLFNSFVYKKRTRYGARLLPATQALRILLREKQTPSITFFIADQFPGHDNGIAVNFLQQRTFMFAGAEQLAKRIDAYVGYVELKPLHKQLWEINIKIICEHAADTTDGQITRTFAHMLEESIQRDPSWWLWTHRRWK